MVESEKTQLVSKLEESLNKSTPSEQEEVALIDKFIACHASVYQLPSSVYE